MGIFHIYEEYNATEAQHNCRGCLRGHRLYRYLYADEVRVSLLT